MATNTDEAEKSFSTLGNMSSSQEDRLEALNQTLKTVLLTAKQTDIEKFQKHRLTLLRLRKILKKEGNKDIKPLEEALFKILLAYQNSPKGQDLYGKLLVSHHASQQQ
jgi:hypothetical protein